jgi:hypothetical protein
VKLYLGGLHCLEGLKVGEDDRFSTTATET